MTPHSSSQAGETVKPDLTAVVDDIEYILKDAASLSARSMEKTNGLLDETDKLIAETKRIAWLVNCITVIVILETAFIIGALLLW